MPTVDQMTKEQARELFETDHIRGNDAFYWDDLHDSLINHISCLLDDDPRYAYLRIYTKKSGGGNNGASKCRMADVGKMRITIEETLCDCFEISDFELDLDTLGAYGSVAERKAFLTDVVGLTLPEQLALHAGATFRVVGCRVLPELLYTSNDSYRCYRAAFLVDRHSVYCPDDERDRKTLLETFRNEYEYCKSRDEHYSKVVYEFQESVAKWLPMLSGADLLALFPDHAALAKLYIGALNKLRTYYIGFVETLEEGLAKQSEYLRSFEYWYDTMEANEIEFEIDEGEDND